MVWSLYQLRLLRNIKDVMLYERGRKARGVDTGGDIKSARKKSEVNFSQSEKSRVNHYVKTELNIPVPVWLFLIVVLGLLWASHPDPEAMKSFTDLVSQLLSTEATSDP